jgi:hypothetical protein
MSTLSALEKIVLGEVFSMREGYVLNFSNRDFDGFFLDFNVDIYSDKYLGLSGSKANRLRKF